MPLYNVSDRMVWGKLLGCLFFFTLIGYFLVIIIFDKEINENNESHGKLLFLIVRVALPWAAPRLSRDQLLLTIKLIMHTFHAIQGLRVTGLVLS